MKKLALIAVLATGALVLPAQARPPHPAHPTHPRSAKTPLSCTPHNVGYRAGGTLSQNQTFPLALTKSQGAPTATTSDDRYTGDVIVNVKKANHGAPTGDNKTFHLTNAKVKFHFDDNNNGTRDLTDPKAGDRVTLHGTISKVHHGCTPITPTITVKKVDFNKPPKT